MPDERLFLAEVIFELRWRLTERAPGIKLDPNYKLFVGSFFEKIKSEFEYHQELPAASIPDEITPYLIKHRFRKGGEEGWPLVQLGSGMVTYNDTENYSWRNFKSGIKYLSEKFFNSYPEVSKMRIDSLSLKYVNARQFDFSNNVISYIQQKLGVVVKLPTALLASTDTEGAPNRFNMEITHKLPSVQGDLTFSVGRGTSKGHDAIVWQTIIKTESCDQIRNDDDVTSWATTSHEAISSWYKELHKELTKEE